MYNYKNRQCEAYITILYINKLIAKIGRGALYIKVGVTTLITILVVFINILITPIYPKLNSQTDNIYLERFC